MGDRVRPSPLDGFLARVEDWPHWLRPSPDVSADQVRRVADLHLTRLRWVLLPLGMQVPAAIPEIVALSPQNAAEQAAADFGWRQALTRAADVAANTARRTGRQAAATSAWQAGESLVWRQVWQVTAGRWVGCWRCAPMRGGGWQLQPALLADHAGARPAMTAARHAAAHHAMQALWLAAGPDYRGRRSPFGPLARLWRWGYWPLGPDREGRFLVGRII